MGTKTLSITEEAYRALVGEKRPGESFTDTILRLVQRQGKLSDLFGAWQMTDEEEQRMWQSLRAMWQRATERVQRVSPG